MRMRVVKVELEGSINSFRYPHFHVGRQATYPMPPPATIYGHISSAAGEYIGRDTLRFAYVFTNDGRGDDLELVHITKLGTQRKRHGWKYPGNIEVQPNVLLREILFRPKLTLYIDPKKDGRRWFEIFRSPAYPVLL